MKLSPKSLVLLAIAAALAMLVAFDLRAVVVPPPALPVLPQVAYAEATKITIGDQINVLTMSRPDSNGEWRLLAPLDYPADEDVIREFIKAIGSGIAMDTQIDVGNLDQYTVDDQHALRVDVWTTGAEPALSMIVGKTAGPKSSFVRLPGSDVVYRADIGPRTRFDRPAGSWRDKAIVNVERADVIEFRLDRADAHWVFRRGPSPGKEKDGTDIPGPFTMDSAPFAVDAETVELVVRSLTRMRAGEIHNAAYEAGFAQPLAVATLVARDGQAHVVRLGNKVDEKASFVQVDGVPEVFRTSAQIRAQLLMPLDQLRDKTLAKLDRQRFDTMTWIEGGITVSMRWSPELVKWVVVQPANMDVDQRAAATTSANLSNLRALGVAVDGAFTPSGVSAKVRLSDNTGIELIFGQPVDGDGGKLRAKMVGRNDVYFLDPRVVADIRAGFGRG